MMRGVALGLPLSLCLACGGQDSVIGPSEPFRVRNAQFIPGALPGEPAADSAADPESPLRVSLELKNSVLLPGQGGKSLSGRAGADAWAIGVTLEGAGRGYYVVPVGALDSATGELTWSATADFDESLTEGKRRLLAVAIDPSGVAGQQAARDVCIASPVHPRSCSAKATPPKTVISLEWDTNADLDLQVLTPEGRLVTPKRPSTQDPEGETSAVAAGRIDRDSNANCVADGIRRENLSWPTDAPLGTFGVFVNLADACKQPAVRFRVSVYTAAETAPESEIEADAETEANHALVLRSEVIGELLDWQANPGSGRGMFVSEFTFPIPESPSLQGSAP
ncbi:MAG TPA: hypothetical protein VFQ61_11775 [Polyangiaceae bacterium]|nr:hypothetical protein [Polyangiaceae bacterium]